MKKLIIIGALVLVAILAVFAVKKLGRPTTNTLSGGNPALGTATTTVIASPLPKITPENSASLDEAWNVFQKYLAALKKHDLTTLPTFSYQVSATCKDATKTRDCNALMDSAASFGSDFTKAELKHVVGDQKQTILLGDYVELLTGDAPSIERTAIYFARDNGVLKVLYFSPFDGAFIVRGDLATTTIATRLTELVKDTDEDTLPDAVETCSDMNAAPDCVKTDPTKKDTNGNGWWDSIEKLLNR